MLVRIVKMNFRKEEIEHFQLFFQEKKNFIRNFEGCRFLELYQDKNDPEIFFTYSYWENEAALDNYRHSELFKNVWAATKKMFGGKPEAWSVDKIVSLP
ncbi:MAG TPA: antibiotic biosynthesis monooxygenase family protein [Flavobacteriaceae bacterium]|nr:antibiotic biosynthesis monooxygenase family protein [Flavobacteriaceae bacterium]